MENTKHDRSAMRSLKYLIASFAMFALGFAWIVVILYRSIVRHIGGELGNSIMAGVSIGLGFTFAYIWSSKIYESKNRIAAQAALAILSTIILTIAFQSLSMNLAT